MTQATAVLMMESKGLAPNVRSRNLHAAWSRLYRTDTHFIDLTFNTTQAGVLQGQLLNADDDLTPVSGKVILRHTGSEQAQEALVDGYGQFRLETDLSQAASLDIYLEHLQLTIPSLS
jgi:hypothetical protein